MISYFQIMAISISAFLSWNVSAQNLSHGTLEVRTSSSEDRVQLLNNEAINIGPVSYVHFLSKDRREFSGCEDAKMKIGLIEVHSSQRSNLVVLLQLKNKHSGKVESSEIGTISLGEELVLPLKSIAYKSLDIWSVSDQNGKLAPGWMQAEQPILTIEYSSESCGKSYKAEFSGDQDSMLVKLTSLFGV
jgi:hypothetical protein